MEEYKKQAKSLILLAQYFEGTGIPEDCVGKIYKASESINVLLARAAAAEARAHELETAHRIEMCEDGYDCAELGKTRKKLEAAEDQLKEIKNCVAGLSMLIKAVDGKMVMETVLPMACFR